MADAFLHPISHRRNLTVYTQSQALRLLMDDQVHEHQRHGAWTTAAHRATVRSCSKTTGWSTSVLAAR